MTKNSRLSNFYFNKFLRWFSCTLKSQYHWSSVVTRDTSWGFYEQDKKTGLEESGRSKIDNYPVFGPNGQRGQAQLIYNKYRYKPLLMAYSILKKYADCFIWMI